MVSTAGAVPAGRGDRETTAGPVVRTTDTAVSGLGEEVLDVAEGLRTVG